MKLAIRQAILPALFAVASLASSPAPADECKNCGIVKTVNAVKVKGPSSGGGAVAGGLVGGVVGNQFGSGSGRTLATVAGVAGGAYAGNEIEKNAKSHYVWKVAVEMDYGERRNFTLRAKPGFGEGDRVRIQDGKPVRVSR